MKINERTPPRIFKVGHDQSIEIAHCADIELASDEQITLVTPSGTEFDVVRKSWGYYATPSLNRRLCNHGLRAVLVKGQRLGGVYLLLVERGHEDDFYHYVREDALTIVCWLDSNKTTDDVISRLKGAPVD